MRVDHVGHGLIYCVAFVAGRGAVVVVLTLHEFEEKLWDAVPAYLSDDDSRHFEFARAGA